MANYNDFLNWVDLPRFAKACHNISTSPKYQILNRHSNRMLKEQFILGALHLCNHAKNIQWVDTIDYDLIFDNWSDGNTVEVKSGDGPMFTEVKGLQKECVEIKLKNIYESKVTRTNFNKQFDHLMIIQNTDTFAVGFTPYETAIKYLQPKLSDGWKTRIPFDEIQMVYTQNVRKDTPSFSEDANPRPWILDVLRKEGV